MTEEFRFELVSPERVLASEEADAVDLPASEGDMTAMRDHAALITTLKPGLLRVKSHSGTREFVVTGGFVEVSAEATTVLAEKAYAGDEITDELIDGFVSDAEKRVSETEGAARDIAETRLACMKSLRSEITR
ncbi:MAG: ATP synthase F1 subunit epsilon [Rhodobacteraceae bacterium]|nr:ATP synthase F1 subunit epsilon [Paracoccaceae bacterium]